MPQTWTPRARARGYAAIAVVAVTLAAPGIARAADFSPGPGTYTANTTALTLTGPGVNVTGADVGGVAVFSFGNISIPAGATIVATGNLPFELNASGSFVLGGVINASGTSATNFASAANAGGAGGGAGGADGSTGGGGPGGGGVASNITNGGGGGGFGGAGARGGCDSGTCASGQDAGAAGHAYGDLTQLFEGGSGGAGGSTTEPAGGGGGGGAVELVGATMLIGSGASVLANGGNGAVAGNGASGGGSGGGILLRANTLGLGGTVSAAGGQGGVGSCCGDGGGGGGGRVVYEYGTVSGTSAPNVSGGTSGTASNPAGSSGGGASPDPTGANGSVVSVPGATVTTSPASGVGATSATVSGAINPNGNPTTYHFDYGTSAAYGAQAPVGAVAVGSDSSIHLVSQTLSGLTPGTTYHYRVVATAADGASSDGADATFTTAPAPPAASASVSVSGSRVAVTVTCHGAAGSCSGAIAATSTLTVCGPATAVSAAAKPSSCTKVSGPVPIGSAHYGVGAGGHQTVTIGLTRMASKLLARFTRVPFTIAFIPSAGLAPGSLTAALNRQRVGAAVHYTFKSGARTAVRSLSITGVPGGGSVTVSCHGAGCPYAAKTFRGRTHVSVLAGAHLAAGTKVTISISAPGRVGEVVTFTFRAHKAPKVVRS